MTSGRAAATALVVVLVLTAGAVIGYYYLSPMIGTSAPIASSSSSSSSLTSSITSSSASSALTSSSTGVTTALTRSVSSSSSVSATSTGSSSSSRNLNGTFTAKVTSVKVAQVGFNSTTGAKILRSNVTIQFNDTGNNVVNYAFSVEPWNLTLMQGTEDQVDFANGQLIGLQSDVSGIIQEHTHILLHVVVAGALQNVPSGMGISGGTKANNASQYIDSGIIGPIHTHDTSNIIHFEISIQNYNFTLGEMFSEWGYAFNSTCVWGHCASNAVVKVYINSTTPYVGSSPQSLAMPLNVDASKPTNVTIVWTP